MGKATIINHIGDGNYNIQIEYDTENKDKRIAAIEVNIQQLEDKLLNLEPGSLEYNVANLQITALNKDKAAIEAFPDSKNATAWCADLTENLSGPVGTMEIPGESPLTNIQPGFGGGANYDKGRDGQLVHTMLQDYAGCFFNLAMLPGWQKWKPTFRYGAISNLDGDTCDVELERVPSSQQGLNVNQSSTLSSVEIDYMDCNGVAFEDGNSVVVMFGNQDWSQPKVIGFKAEPQPCGLDFFIKPVFNGHDPVKGNQEIKVEIEINGVISKESKRVYGVNNAPSDPVMNGLADFRGTTLPPAIFVRGNDTTVSLKSNGPMGVINKWTPPAAIDNYDYMQGFTFLHYYSTFAADSYDFKHKGTYFKKVEYKPGEYFLLDGWQTTVEVEGKTYPVYEMNFEQLSALSQQPNTGALENKNPWVMHMAHNTPGPGTYGPWLDVQYSHTLYYSTAYMKATDYAVDQRSEFQNWYGFSDCLYGTDVNGFGWYRTVKELNRNITDTLGLHGVTGNLPVVCWAILSNKDGSNPSFSTYSVTRKAGTYRFYYKENCAWGGQPASPEEGGENYNPYEWTWEYKIAETPPEVW